jgi:hypothetical protein
MLLHFNPSLIFDGKARSQPVSGVLVKSSTIVQASGAYTIKHHGFVMYNKWTDLQGATTLSMTTLGITINNIRHSV